MQRYDNPRTGSLQERLHAGTVRPRVEEKHIGRPGALAELARVRQNA